MASLESQYWGTFIFCGLLCLVLQLYSRYYGSSNSSKTIENHSANARFASFQSNYLFVFLLAMFSDWLQGPYVYELYVSYGFTQQQIAELFVCGFGSSMIVGTFAGGLADKLGRKVMCVMYSVSYIIACCTKLVPEYWTLMLGRFLSGVSTSLLFSVFESWMVGEHFKQGFSPEQLSDTFSLSTLGNGLAAVIAGLIANTAAESYGYFAPFVVAIAPLSLIAVIIMFSWQENYGNQSLSMTASLWKGFDLIRNDSKIAALGMGQSCFEGAMYTFVFMWTPALKSAAEVEAEAKGITLPESTSQFLGLIFAVFMVCVMVGSSVFKLFSNSSANLYKMPLVMHAVSCLSMGVTALCLENKTVVYLMFLLFESTVGVFYPSYGMIKSEKIPEEIRSAVMNIFRIPLNAFVVLLLLKIKYLSSFIVFSICTGAHATAFLCYLYFYTQIHSNVKTSSAEDDYDPLLKNDSA